MPMTDQQFLAEALGGKPEAFAALVRRYQGRLYNSVYRVLDHPEDSQDIVQEAFLSAYQALAGFRQGSEFYTWLHRIAVNAALDLRKKRRPQTGLDPGGLADDSAPGAALERDERREQLQRALGRLKPRDRALLVMKDLEGESYEAIGAALNIPPGTVRSGLHRARIKLRRAVEALSPGDPPV